jgi:hypothetical protein
MGKALMAKTFIRTVILLLPMTLAGQPKPAPAVAPAATVGRELAELRREVSQLRKEVEKYDSWFKGRDMIARDYREKVDSVMRESVTLDPSETSYGIISIPSGTFFIALDKVEPFLDGYRITLKLGNPYVVLFKDIKLKVEWNKRIPSNPSSYEAWVRETRTQEFSDTTDLGVGQWTRFSLVLAATKPDQLGYLNVKLSIGAVSMGR